MRVGIISPNLLMQNHPCGTDKWWVEDHWTIDTLGKKAAILFDILYLRHDLDVTRSLLSGLDGDDENWQIRTLDYLVDNGLIVTAADFGCRSGAEFLARNLTGVASRLHDELCQVGNPGIEGDEDELIGQPDIGDFAAHDGCHPRDFGRRGKLSANEILRQQQEYESVLVRRNAALLAHAGADDAVIIGSLFQQHSQPANAHPVWRVIVSNMPSLDVTAPWEDILGFRAEQRTQHLVRSLRPWIRKIASEQWSEGDLQDEVAEILFEYEAHMRARRLSSGSSVLEFLITGSAELAENAIKLRIGKIGKTVSAAINGHVRLYEEELKAPGRELALIPEMKTRF